MLVENKQAYNLIGQQTQGPCSEKHNRKFPKKWNNINMTGQFHFHVIMGIPVKRQGSHVGFHTYISMGKLRELH